MHKWFRNKWERVYTSTVWGFLGYKKKNLGNAFDFDSLVNIQFYPIINGLEGWN